MDLKKEEELREKNREKIRNNLLDTLSLFEEIEDIWKMRHGDISNPRIEIALSMLIVNIYNELARPVITPELPIFSSTSSNVEPLICIKCKKKITQPAFPITLGKDKYLCDKCAQELIEKWEKDKKEDI